jgi:nicotinamide mononucleotide transporter
MSPLEIGAVAMTLVCVWLTVKQNIWCWPTGIVGVTLYGFVFYDAKLYADMGLQAIYFVLSVWGWYEWLHGGKGGSELGVSYARARVQTIAYVVGGAFAIALGSFLRRKTDAALPFIDSALTSYSLVAQWLMTEKYIENWIVWVSVDIVYVGMFYYKHLYLTSLLYLVFMGMSTMGYLQWKRSVVREVAANG